MLDLQFGSRFLCAFYMFGSVPFWFCKQNFDWMIRFGQNDKTLLRLVTRLFTTHSRFISSITIYFPHSIPLLFWDLLGFHQGQTYRHSTPPRRFEKREIRSVWTAIPRGCNNALYIFSFFLLRWMNFKDFLKRPKTSEIYLYEITCTKVHVFEEGHKNWPNLHHLIVTTKCQIDGEDFVNFCGLLRKPELYLAYYFDSINNKDYDWWVSLLISRHLAYQKD